MVSVSLDSNRPWCMRRWPSSVGLDGSVSRILAFTSLTEVVPATLGKCRGPFTPLEGEMITRLKLIGLRLPASPAAATAGTGAPEAADIAILKRRLLEAPVE